jgi:DNA-binding NarL/FixJ family response regulator
MSAHSLLLAKDPGLLTVLRCVLEELGLQVEVCAGRELALQRLSEQKYDLVVLDWEEFEGASFLVFNTRLTSHNKESVVIAVVSGVAAMRNAQTVGANFILCKPLLPEPVRRTVRAASTLFTGTEPRHVRHVVRSLSFVSLETPREPAVLLNLSQGGMAVQALEPLAPGRVLQLKFDLPKETVRVEAQGEIVWSDPSGRAGIRFLDMPQMSQQNLKEWVARMEAGGYNVEVEVAAAQDPFTLAPWQATARKSVMTALDAGVVLASLSVFALVLRQMSGSWPQTGALLLMTAGAVAVLGAVYRLLFSHFAAATPGSRVARLFFRRTRVAETPPAATAPAEAAVNTELEPVLAASESRQS